MQRAVVAEDSCIAAEMLLFCGVHLYSGDADHKPLIYWLVVVAICAFVVLRQVGGGAVLNNVRRKASFNQEQGMAGRKKSGSPDVMSAAERIDGKIAELGDWRGERLSEIRELIHEVDPAVVEEWKWRGSPVWSHEGMYALANAHKHKVKLTFMHGAELADPNKLFNAGLEGNKWRAIDFAEGDEIDKVALGALLREAVEYNREHSVPKSKGSRE